MFHYFTAQDMKRAQQSNQNRKWRIRTITYNPCTKLQIYIFTNKK